MPSNNQRNNELEFTPTFGTQQLNLAGVLTGVLIIVLECNAHKIISSSLRI